MKIFAKVLLFGLLCSGCNNQPEKQSADNPDNSAIEQMVADAYFHCFPIVENYKALYAYGVDTSSPKYLPMNTLYNTRNLYTPADKYVVSPNNDTYYTTVTADLRAEPLIIKVPAVKDRYYSFQLNSMVTDNFGYIGTNTTGTDAGIYAVTGPNYSGPLPPGVKEIKSPSEFLGLMGRTQVNVSDPKDVKQAQAVQDKYQIGVMHKFYPEFPPAEVKPINFPTYKEEDKATPKFFSLLNFLLQFIRLSDDEKKIMDGFKASGIEAGKPYTYFDDHPKLQPAIQNGINKGMQMVDSSARKMGEIINGWTMFPLGEYFGKNYIARTNVAKMGIYANSPFEAYYPLAFVDQEGNPLNGNNSYAITFKAGQLPPVKYFWSITMYDSKTQLLVENKIKRYSIGDRTKGMVYGKDSSLTIYFGANPPMDQTSNWLPAPNGDFNVMMRMYGPKDMVLNGQWTPPPIVRLTGK
ncbi:DUF1214 domain-containing protein [Flavihumibacter rivuli]|uniref:DUF1254 domain-containing protein n=1 Tax=Flavihumibacter rivuli TaxID=2838156 RepID=UPI001BDE8165|nr:DUF1214 domain-containing protein [Flavihumibacter rivuli]ULQ55820.1 DUF1214 domain-containing protein [Flavihumibacter rivuli]